MRRYRKIIDTGIMLAVFIIAVIHLWGLSKVNTANPAIITDYGDYHLVYWYPLQNCLIEFVFAVFLLFKAIRFSACLYTRIATWLYLSLTTVSLAHILFIFNYNLYINIIEMIFLYAIFAIVLIFIIKCGLKR